LKQKKEAQVFLEQDERLKVQIECLLAEKQQWHDLSVSITACMDGERVQSSGSQDKMGNAVAVCVDMEGEIEQAVLSLAVKRKELAQVLEKVENPTWFKLLHLRFIQHKQLKEVADIMCGSYDWAKTTQGRALACVQAILDGK
jgi:hypothetical protein